MKETAAWHVASPSVAALSSDWDLGYTEDRSLGNEQTPVNTVKNDDAKEDHTVKNNNKSRLIRFIIYWISLGIFLDIAIFYARYSRSNPNHDEFHAAIMMLSFLSAFGMDLWFIITSYKELFSGNLEADIYFYLICASNLLALPQLGRLFLTPSVRQLDQVQNERPKSRSKLSNNEKNTQIPRHPDLHHGKSQVLLPA